MAEFSSTDSYHRFEQTVKRETRYVYDVEVRDFLAAVMETSQKRKDSIEKSSILFRAQRGYTWRTENAGTEEAFEVPDAFDPERMVPKAEFVGDGRVDPRGIPCLYLASTQEAAVAEVRPWVGSYVSLAQFKIMRDVVVVDCPRTKGNFQTGSCTQLHRRYRLTDAKQSPGETLVMHSRVPLRQMNLLQNACRRRFWRRRSVRMDLMALCIGVCLAMG
jgi:hypothetical protein